MGSTDVEEVDIPREQPEIAGNVEVPEEIRRKATKCRYDFACLSDDGVPPMCNVDRCISDRYLFVTPRSGCSCPYCIEFGFASHGCTGPGRNSIYLKYGI